MNIPQVGAETLRESLMWWSCQMTKNTVVLGLFLLKVSRYNITAAPIKTLMVFVISKVQKIGLDMALSWVSEFGQWWQNYPLII